MSEISSLIDLNDEDIIVLEKVLTALNARQGKTMMLDAFRREAEERFAEAGFRVEVKAFETDQPGLYAFDIDITERLKGEFDLDKMVWEATHNVLGIGEEGTISGASPSKSFAVGEKPEGNVVEAEVIDEGNNGPSEEK